YCREESSSVDAYGEIGTATRSESGKQANTPKALHGSLSRPPWRTLARWPRDSSVLATSVFADSCIAESRGQPQSRRGHVTHRRCRGRGTPGTWSHRAWMIRLAVLLPVDVAHVAVAQELAVHGQAERQRQRLVPRLRHSQVVAQLFAVIRVRAVADDE